MDIGKQSRLSRPHRISESSKVCITLLLLLTKTFKIIFDNWNKSAIKYKPYEKLKLKNLEWKKLK